MVVASFKPDYATPPGWILEEALEERSMSRADLARHTGLSEKHISQTNKRGGSDKRGNRYQVGTRHGHTRPALEQYGTGVQIALGPFGRRRETVFLNPDYSPPSRGRGVTGSGFRHPAGYPPPGRSLAVRQ